GRALGGGVNDAGGGARRLRVDAHAEWPVGAEAEAAGGRAELERAHPEVEQAAVDVAPAHLGEVARELVEATAAQEDAITSRSEAFTRPGDRLGVAIDAEQPQPGGRSEQCRGVSPE